MRAGRFRQQPAELMSLDRILRFREILALSTRMIFLNIFNRTQLSNPTTTSPLAAMTCTGAVGRSSRIRRRLASSRAGFGFSNYVGGSPFLPPRQGVLEMRIQF